MTRGAPAKGAQEPPVLALDDPGAVPAVAGGKGASLGRLARAGVRVPAGFHVTTAAYLDFLDGGLLRQELLAAVSAVDGSDAASSEAAAARIGELFAGQPVPASTATAIAVAYASLGDDDVPVAVRSSATVEDLAGLSAAGQHDTYLNMRGEAAVIDAVLRCWASLWTARAIGYRAGRGIAPGEVSIAVVVQRLVPAEAAGVLFTVDPVSGALDQVVDQRQLGPRRVRHRRRRHPGRRGRRPGVGDAGQLPTGRQGGHDRGRRRRHAGDRDAGRPALGAGAFSGPGG